MKDFLHIPLRRRAGRVVWLCALIPSWEGAHRLRVVRQSAPRERRQIPHRILRSAIDPIVCGVVIVDRRHRPALQRTGIRNFVACP